MVRDRITSSHGRSLVLFHGSNALIDRFSLRAGQGYGKLRQAPEQDAHAVRALRPPQLSPAEEHLLLMRLPRGPHPQV